MEALAVRGHQAKLSSLADVVKDSMSRSREILFNPADDSEVDDWSPEEYAREAWTCLHERKLFLGSAYPFVVSRTRLSLEPGTLVSESSYIGLLSLTLAHAFGIGRTNEVEYLFEEIVALAMESAGLKVGRMGVQGRATGTFQAALEQVGESLGVTTDSSARVRRMWANDEDVDLVGELSWSLSRKGRWFYVGQATCAKSDEWRKKINEPTPQDWRAFLGDYVSPVPFLAVPHHVDSSAYQYVVATDRRLVDRLNLTANLAVIPPQLQDVIQLVSTEDMQTFQV